MGVKHQLILGVILIWTLYISQGTATEVNSTTVGNTIEDVTQRNVNLIEKLPKTDTEQRDVYSNTHDSTTIKINLTTNDPSASNNLNTTSLEITTPSIKKENVIKKDGIGKSREDNTRSIDLEKYVSPEFQNNVFTPNFSDTEKYFDFKSSTEKSSSFSDFDLTTPKSDLFDIRFKEVSEGVRQKLEQDFDDNQNDNDHDTDDGNEHEHDDLHDDDDDKNEDDDEMQVDKLLEEPKIIPNTTLDYKEMKNIIVKNNTDGKMSTHNNVIVEKVKRVNVESNFNDTKTYDYDSKDDMEITSTKHDLPTTRKPINLTKPPNNENISDILNNKIETGPIKAIISTTEFTATKRTGDNEQVSRESQLEKQVLPFNVTTEGTVNLSSTSTAEAMTTTTTTTGEEEITTLSEATSVKDQSTTIETKTEPITVAIMSNNFTTEITDIPSTTFDSGTSSTTIIDETTVTIYTESTTTESTSFTPTTQYIDITTITDASTTEDVTKASELLTTEDIAIILTTKRSENYFESQNIGNKSSTVPVTETTTTRSTTTTSQPKTTIKTIVYTSSASSEAIEITDIRNTTVSTFAFSPTFVSVIPTTQGIAFRNDLATEEFTEMSYATETSVSPQEHEDGEGNKKAVVIAISTVAAICLILLAGLLYIMRKRQKRFNYKQRCRPVSLDDYSVDNVSAYNSVRRKGADRQSKRSYGNPAFDDPSAPSHPLNFPALAKFASNIDDIKLEFDDIPQITAKTSELPEGCEPKNRYANVIPLPETRVSLKIIEGYPNSDYINANYVIGPKKTKGFYIACQAPMQNTVDDFWRMIWEQQTKVILMVTHFFENGVEKCVDYLPPSEVLDCHRLFGDFQVTLKKRDVKEKYIISSLQLKNMVSNSWREVTHFWYLGWPEKGIPEEANSLIAFLIEARSFMKTSTLDRNAVANGTNSLPRTDVNPVVVHCSPGTGRTGVVMACDIAIREFEQTRLVDIPKIVYMIRRDRANAVQTKEQYIFIYKVVSLYATKLTGGALESL